MKIRLGNDIRLKIQLPIGLGQETVESIVYEYHVRHIEDPDLKITIGVPNSSSYSFLQDGVQYTKEQLGDTLYSSAFDEVPVDGIIEVTYRCDFEAAFGYGTFIRRKIETIIEKKEF